MVSTQPLHLILVDPRPALCDAFRERFKAFPEVSIVNSRFEELSSFDCFVTAGNSFGLMDGGVDAATTRFFGASIQERVQQYILKEFLGEQPVGTSFVIHTDHPKHPFLAHTPTMRIPMPIARTDHVYAAMWATLIAVYRHNQGSPEMPIHSLACPGLGTGTGEVPYHEAARQMALAYRFYLDPPTHLDWRVADQRQDLVRYGGDVGLSFPVGIKWNDENSPNTRKNS